MSVLAPRDIESIVVIRSTDHQGIPSNKVGRGPFVKGWWDERVGAGCSEPCPLIPEAGIRVGGAVNERPYIRETMHSALNLYCITRAQLISATRGRASQPKVLAMATDCSATCQQGYVQPR